MEGKHKGLTAGIIIIGDEILKGHVQDTNSHYLCHQLWLLGVKVCKIVVVGDHLESIAEEVKIFSSSFNFVLTTGGVGPTHDDVTLEAVGKAFGEECCLHPDILKALLGDGKEDDLSNPWRKMAIAPKSTKVYTRVTPDDPFSFILMTVHNVHCYPGVPSLMKSVFQNNKDLYSQSATKFFLKEVFFSCNEDVLAQPLSRVQAEFPSVQLGSYPDTDPRHSYIVKISLESDSKEMVQKVYTRLVLSLPAAVMMSAKSSYEDENDAPSSTPCGLRKSLSWFFQRLTASKSSLVPTQLCQRIHDSIQTLEKALLKYSFDELCVAFNGGKDCTVMISLLHSVLNKQGHNFSESKLKALYVMQHEPFPEVEEFMEQSRARYNLEIIRIPGTIREALSMLKESRPEVKAILMGTRHTDPHSRILPVTFPDPVWKEDLVAFSPTDSSWPEYMRINCILDWSYSDVWLFLKLFEVQYCQLYNHGYTSLDGMQDTFPNPALLVTSNSDSTAASSGASRTGKDGIRGVYLPAYMLSDEGLERAGRTCRNCH